MMRPKWELTYITLAIANCRHGLRGKKSTAQAKPLSSLAQILGANPMTQDKRAAPIVFGPMKGCNVGC